MRNQRIGIVGLGWLGLPLAKELVKTGNIISGTVTSSHKKDLLKNEKIETFIIKFSENEIDGAWEEFIKPLTILIINIPPSGKDNGISNYHKMISTLINTSPLNADLKIIFISSTSVYSNGDIYKIYTEESALTPTKPSGKILVAVENMMRERFKNRITIIRFAGLYGPNRKPGSFLKAGRLLPNPAAFINLIHQIDCINLIKAVIETDGFGEDYNGCSNYHPSRKDYYTKAALFSSLPAPSFDTKKESVGKIISNEKAQSLLGENYSYQNPWEIITEQDL